MYCKNCKVVNNQTNLKTLQWEACNIAFLFVSAVLNLSSSPFSSFEYIYIHVIKTRK